MRTPFFSTLLSLLLLCGGSFQVLAQEADPRDEDIFGEEQREEDMFGGGEETLQNASPIKEPEDTLEVGGSLYMQFAASIPSSDDLNDYTVNAPTNVDLYLDSRPNDRLRGFVRGRLLWDPSTRGGGTASLFGTEAGERTQVLLDEIWMRFDAARTVFFTVGQAHVRWGTTRIWNPVDVLQPSRRDPLAFYDLRVGVPQIKMHLPIESLGWNFYLMGLMDSVDTVRKAGGAARAEFVFSTVETGVTGALRYGVDPKTGLDFSMGIGDLDWTGECGVSFPSSSDPEVQVSTGLEYSVSVFDEDILLLGTEFFYNPGGYDSLEDAVYDTLGITRDDVAAASSFIEPGIELDEETLAASNELLETSAAALSTLQPFYIGKYYGGFLVSLPQPGNWNDVSFSVLTLSNLSDRSALSRLDVSINALTYLQIQTYISGYWGLPGELKPGPDSLGEFGTLLSTVAPLPPSQLLQVGFNLRMDL